LSQRTKWRTRKRGSVRQLGQRFPIYPRPDKSSLPSEFTIVSEPQELSPKEKLKEELRKTKEKMRQAKEKIQEFTEEQESEGMFTEEEILEEVARQELAEELGVEPEQIKFTDDDEITLKTIIRTPREPEKKEDTEVDWVEHKRRETEFKRTKGLSSVR